MENLLNQNEAPYCTIYGGPASCLVQDSAYLLQNDSDNDVDFRIGGQFFTVSPHSKVRIKFGGVVVAPLPTAYVKTRQPLPEQPEGGDETH